MLRKPAVIISSCGSHHSLYCPQIIPSKTISATDHSPQSSRTGHRKYQRRSYATVRADDGSQRQTDDLPWPKLSGPSTTPTPYQILSTKREDPYSKRRFYELVKLYHPDRNDCGCGEASIKLLSGAVKMERYRLVVAAHEILSDPVKRNAYDTVGAGWNGRPEHGASNYHSGQNDGTRWSGFDTNDSPFRNATWEDWEKWYQRDKAKQEPVYFSNGGFLMLVITAVFFGGFGQSVRVGDYSAVFKRQAEVIHDDASKVLRQRKTDSTSFDDRHARLQRFLESRDPHGYKIPES